MWIMFGGILLSLGLLILALRGFFGTFPDSWQWVGIVLAGVGIIVGVPSIFQMLVGRSKLVAYFVKRPDGLAVLLKNLPIEKGSVWHKLGIRRDSIESLEVGLELSESGSGAVKLPIIHPRILDDADATQKNRIMLPPTFSVGAAIEIVYWMGVQKGALFTGDTQRVRSLLSKGRYRIKFAFLVDGISVNRQFEFVVGDTIDDLSWVLPNPDREDYQIV